MGFLRNIAGSVIALSLATLVDHYTELQPYAALCMGVPWLSALYAVPKQDERFFDLTGSVTYAVVSLLAYSTSGSVSWRELLLTVLVWLWCVRLGSFLFLRITECGEDKRFKDIRVNPLRFLGVWSIQGLWVLLTVLPVLLTLQHGVHNLRVSPLDGVGVSLGGWLRDGGHGRLPKDTVPSRQEQQGPIHPERTLALQPPPQLLGRDHDMSRCLLLECPHAADTSTEMLGCRKPHVRDVPARVRVRYPAAGKAGRRALG